MNKLTGNAQVFGWLACAAALFAAGVVVGVAVAPHSPLPKVLAATSLEEGTGGKRKDGGAWGGTGRRELPAQSTSPPLQSPPRGPA